MTSIQALRAQRDILREYIETLHKLYEPFKEKTFDDMNGKPYHKDNSILVMSVPTDVLKEAWDKYPDDEYELEGFIDEIHLELNMRGEGKYCAV